MDKKILKILNSGKSSERYRRVLHLLNNEDCSQYEARSKKTVLAQMDKAFHAVFLFLTFFQMK